MDYTYPPSNDYPLRILVPSDSVGAIIGRQGSTIKQIKQATYAKVDVDRNESLNSQERVIIIRGQPESCRKACREILKIMYQDAQSKSKTTDTVLKVLAHNNFIGRIIGKGGNIISGLKKETDTNITVSSIAELNSFNFERVISITGELDQQMKALEMIYAKLCLANEADSVRTWGYQSSQYMPPQQPQLIQQYPQQTLPISGASGPGPSILTSHYSQPPQPLIPHPSVTQMNGTSSKYVEPSQAAHPAAMFTTPYYQPMFQAPGQYYHPYPPPNQYVPSHAHGYPPLVANGTGTYPNVSTRLPAASQPIMAPGTNDTATIETVHLFVPNNAIGAIIGAKGLFIKSIVKNSNASVKISPLASDEDQNKQIERKITITGTPEAQWKSQYYIYDKIRQEGFAGDDEVRLRAEIYVPTSLIGRLIGKGGQHFRHLQQSTGATIKLPEDSQQTSASEIPVKIIGTFKSSQFAQRRIQSIIQTSRDVSNIPNEDSNLNNNEQSSHAITNNTSSNNLNETLATVNGSTISDDAVVASSTHPNGDDQKSSDE